MTPRIIFSIVLFFAIYSGTLAQQLVTGSLNHNGLNREYSIFLPSSYQPGQQLPVVINLHGFALNGSQQISYSELNLIADQEGFIVVIPEGVVGTTFFGSTGIHWNSYWGTGIDDLGFLDLLIDRIYTDYAVDLFRIYATGFSNGGYMSHRLACELSGRIAAIACVAGSVVDQQLNNCNPSRAVPVLQIHGTNDGTVPYNGSPGFAPSVPDLVDHWIQHNNCATTANLVIIPDTDPTDSSTVTRLEYNQGDDSSKVWFYIIDNGGHSWPNASYNLNGAVTNQDFNASQHIWDFFNQFQHPNPEGGTILSAADGLAANAPISTRQVRESLFVSSETNIIRKVRVIDLNGATVADREFSHLQDEVTINLAGISNGIYLAQVETRNGSFSQKFLYLN